MRKLRLILGDQLNYKHSWINDANRNTYFLIMELRQETDYVLHHAQKVVGFFAAMYNYAAYLRKKGCQVIHLKINDAENTHSLTENLNYYIRRLRIEQFEYQMPDEYRMDKQLREYCEKLKIGHRVFDTEHFMTRREELADFFKGKKSYLMESFYRYMRKKHAVLMDGDLPVGGEWNYDKENRGVYQGEDKVPDGLDIKHDYSEIWHEIEKAGVKTFGSANETAFSWPTSRKESLATLHYFIQHYLKHFGKYQDAMHTKYAYLFHSRLSFALNSKMISPREVIWYVEQSLRKSRSISVQSAEGFIRQILGWREYMRGVYWAQMPDYAVMNYFKHKRKLPGWFWSGETKMNCLKHCIGQSLETAYAHHIQRLMITGNFMLLAGIDPKAADDWYLGIYIDAIEWVEITNTRGMSQYADGGIVGTKPYVSSAAYINKMSNYCKNCYYNFKTKTGERACPFNSLYWNFFDKHRDKLENNHRTRIAYVQLEKMGTELAGILEQANFYLKTIEKI